MKPRKLTAVQFNLLELINQEKFKFNAQGVFEFDEMKKATKMYKSFDASFNALLVKGHVKRFESQTGNKFITTLK